MKRKQQSVALAGLLALGLAACSSTGTSSGDMAGTTSSVTSGEAAQSTPPVGSTSTGSSATASAAMGQDSSTSTTMAGTTPNAVVTLIEVVPRSGSPASGASTGSSGTSGTTGASGSTAGSDKVYRVTLMMDDGSSRVITQEWAPSFRSGDRVRLEKGMIQR